jgi:hypothetical protein
MSNQKVEAINCKLHRYKSQGHLSICEICGDTVPESYANGYNDAIKDTVDRLKWISGAVTKIDLEGLISRIFEEEEQPVVEVMGNANSDEHQNLFKLWRMLKVGQSFGVYVGHSHRSEVQLHSHLLWIAKTESEFKDSKYSILRTRRQGYITITRTA